MQGKRFEFGIEWMGRGVEKCVFNRKLAISRKRWEIRLKLLLTI